MNKHDDGFSNIFDRWNEDLEVLDSDAIIPGATGTTKLKRKLTNEDIIKYEPMIEAWIRDAVIKNWNEAKTSKSQGDVALGNSGYTVNDIRQHLRAEVCVALHNYNPNYRTKENRSVKESTFVFNHLRFRVGQMMKRLTKKRAGYGIWTSQIESELWELDRE